MTGPVRAPLVVVALRAEDYAVRRGLPAPPIRVGLRARHRRALADRLCLADPHRPLIVAGLAGAVHPDLRPGDVVLADDVRSRTARPNDPPSEPHPANAYPVTAAPNDPPQGPHADDALLHELREAGLRVHVGPIVTTDHVVDGPERTNLRTTGALAVDMESAPILALAGNRRVIVVRVIADTPRYPLRHPAIVLAGIAGLHTLSRLGPPLCRWSGTVGATLPKEARSR